MKYDEVEMLYKDYVNGKFKNYKTKKGSYNGTTKTIIVYIPQKFGELEEQKEIVIQRAERDLPLACEKSAEQIRTYRDRWISIIDYIENTLAEQAETAKTTKNPEEIEKFLVNRDSTFANYIKLWLSFGDEEGLKTAEEKLNKKF